MQAKDIKVGMKVKHSLSRDELTVEKLGGSPATCNGWFYSNQCRWVRVSEVEPIVSVEHQIEEAFIVDKTLFRSRAEAETHLARVRLYEKLKPFVKDELTDANVAILDKVTEILVNDRKAYAEILGA